MERRSARRHVRRLRVNLTDVASKTHVVGFTVNVSSAGMLITTSRPPKVGARVRAEIYDHEFSVAVEGIVARISHSRTLDQEAVGIRFLSVAEALHELIPQIAPEDERAPAMEAEPEAEADAEAETGEAAKASLVEPSGVPIAPIEVAADLAKGSDFAELAESPFEPTKPPEPPPPPPAPEPAAPPPAAGHHRVSFQSLDDLRRRYDQEIRFGGLFVPSATPPALQANVVLEIVVPGRSAMLVVSSRVVQRLEPRGRDAGGFAVEFNDRSEVLAALAPIVGKG